MASLPFRDPENHQAIRMTPGGSLHPNRAPRCNGCVMPRMRCSRGSARFSLMIRCSPTGAALAAGVVQNLFLFYAPKVAGEDGVPFTRARKLVLPPLENVQFHRFGPDFAVEGYLHDVYRNH